jgi:hypothetical protein
MKNELPYPQRLPPASPCGPLCHRKIVGKETTSTKPITRSDRAPGDVSGAARTSGTAATWAHAKTEPQKQKNGRRSITGCAWGYLLIIVIQEFTSWIKITNLKKISNRQNGLSW